MTYDEIKAELDALVAEMLVKGVKRPTAELTIKSQERVSVQLWCDMGASQFDGEYLKFCYGETPADQIATARAYIATLPDPRTEGERKFTRALAAAVDVATEYALPDELVAPVKIAIQQVNDMLALPAPEATA